MFFSRSTHLFPNCVPIEEVWAKGFPGKLSAIYCVTLVPRKLYLGEEEEGRMVGEGEVEGQVSHLEYMIDHDFAQTLQMK